MCIAEAAAIEMLGGLLLAMILCLGGMTSLGDSDSDDLVNVNG